MAKNECKLLRDGWRMVETGMNRGKCPCCCAAVGLLHFANTRTRRNSHLAHTEQNIKMRNEMEK